MKSPAGCRMTADRGFCFISLREKLFLIKSLDGIHSGGHIGEECICDRESTHGFNDHNGSWHDDRIVAAVDFQG